MTRGQSRIVTEVPRRTRMYALIVPIRRSAKRAGRMRPGMPQAFMRRTRVRDWVRGMCRAVEVKSRIYYNILLDFSVF